MIRPLDINLATRPFRNNSLIWVGHVVVAVGVVAFTAWNTNVFLETDRELRTLRSKVGSIESRMEEIQLREGRVQVGIGKHDLKYLMVQTSRANDVIQRKALSWTRLFNLVEGVLPYEVRMSSIRPVFGFDTGHATPRTPEEGVVVSVEGTAKDLHAFLELERNLISDPHFDRVEPERTTNSPSGELLFDLRFLYFPQGKASGDDEAGAPEPEAPPRGDPAGTEEEAAGPALRRPPPRPGPARGDGGARPGGEGGE